MTNRIKDALKHIGLFIKSNLFFFIGLIVIIALFNIKLPYSVYAPGGIINVDERLTNGLYDSKGKINLTYVTYMEGNIATLLLAKILPNYDIIPNEDIKYDNEDLIDAENRNVIYLYESISSATYNAYTNAGLDVNITDKYFYVIYKAEEANSDIKVGDRLLTVNGEKIESASDVPEVISELNDGDELTITVMRGGKETEVKSKLYLDESGEKRIGIVIDTIYEYDNDPDLKYSFDSNESGSSGGLMLSLAMYNTLTEEDLTNGKNVCGTGTIDLEGNVGEIGGVKYKLSGAVKNDCDVFIVPTDNYEEALKVKNKNDYDIELIEAKTFTQVLEDLKNYVN